MRNCNSVTATEVADRRTLFSCAEADAATSMNATASKVANCLGMATATVTTRLIAVN